MYPPCQSHFTKIILSTEEADAALNDIGKDLLAQTVEYVDVVKQTVVNVRYI